MGRIVVKTMPWVYATEYVCDMLSASKTYNPDLFSGESTLRYFTLRKDYYYMTEATREYVSWCLTRFAALGFKGLKKKDTRAKYAEITSRLPDTEMLENLHPAKEIPPIK